MQISFPVLEEVQKANKEGNHWYCLSMNFQAERFEALDSTRSQGDESLVSHATRLINNIKALWEIHYSTSKVQIKDWELKIIDVPIQANMYVIFFSLHFLLLFQDSLIVCFFFFAHCLFNNLVFPLFFM
jgi:hypothetical protein